MSSELEPCVFVIDSESQIRDDISSLVQSVGLKAQTYGSATEFLEELDPEAPGCLIMDVRLPGMNGLQLQRELKNRGCIAPVIFVSRHGDIPTVVRAVRRGALNFVEKPYREEALLACVQSAVELDRERREEHRLQKHVQKLLDGLTRRERDVLDRMLTGKPNKITARELGISIRTVEIHRSRILQKMGAEQASDVVRMLLMAGQVAGEHSNSTDNSAY